MTLTKHHIILYVLIALAGLGITYEVLSRTADRAQAKLDKMQAVTEQKDSANQTFQKQIVDQLAMIESENIQLKKERSQDETAIAGLKQQLQDQQKKDLTLPPDQKAARIQSLAPGGTVSVIPNGYQLDSNEGDAVLQALDSIPALLNEINLDDAIVKRDDQIIANDGKALDAEKSAHSADVATLTADKATLNQEITTLKDKARVSKLKIGLACFALGLTFGQLNPLHLKF